MAKEITPITLNQYVGTNSLGTQTSIVAEDMETACNIYSTQNDEDPNIMQCVKKGIQCALPEVYVSFKVWEAEPNEDGTAHATGCIATPKAYTVLAGTEQIFTAIPASGWEFTKWEIVGFDDAIDEEEATNPVALIKIPASSSPLSIKAIFTPTDS